MKLNELRIEGIEEFVELVCSGDFSKINVEGIPVRTWPEESHVLRGVEIWEALEVNVFEDDWLELLPELFGALAIGGTVVIISKLSYEQVRFIDRIYSFLISSFSPSGFVHPLGKLVLAVEDGFKDVLAAQVSLRKGSGRLAELADPYNDYDYIRLGVEALDRICSYFDLGGCEYNILLEVEGEIAVIVTQHFGEYDLGMGGLLGLKRIEEAALPVLKDVKPFELSESQEEALRQERELMLSRLKGLRRTIERFEEMGMCQLSTHLGTITRQENK